MEVNKIITGFEPEYCFGEIYDALSFEWVYNLSRDGKDKDHRIVCDPPMRFNKRLSNRRCYRKGI